MGFQNIYTMPCCQVPEPHWPVIRSYQKNDIRMATKWLQKLDRFKVGTCPATNCSNMLQWWLCVFWRILWKSFSPRQNFVTATCCRKSNQTEFLWLVAATKFCFRDRFLQKFCSTHEAMLHCKVLLQLAAWPVHTEWSVATTCCLVCSDLYT